MMAKTIVALGALCGLLTSVGTAAAADPANGTAAAATHRYSEVELNAKDRAGLIDLLAGLPKQQLVDLVLRQQQSEQAAAANGDIATASHADEHTPSRRRMSFWLPLAGLAAGSFAIASFSRGHQAFPAMTNGNLEGLTARSRRFGRALSPLVAPTPASSGSCNSAVQFSCGPYPVHQLTCNTLAAVTTSESSLAPLIVASQPVTNRVIQAAKASPPPNATPDPRTTDVPPGDTAYLVPTGATTTKMSSQVLSGLIGFGVHVFQIGANCTNGSPAVAGTT